MHVCVCVCLSLSLPLPAPPPAFSGEHTVDPVYVAFTPEKLSVLLRLPLFSKLEGVSRLYPVTQKNILRAAVSTARWEQLGDVIKPQTSQAVIHS